MGLLDRWSKKTDKEKLKDLDKKEIAKPKKPMVVKDEKKSTAAGESSLDVKMPEIKGKAGDISYKILVRPLITEKAAVAESVNKYSFVVSKFATKAQIKQAISQAYGVMPRSVNVINVDGRRVRFGKGYGRRGDYRKAIITLPSGKSISIHEGV